MWLAIIHVKDAGHYSPGRLDRTLQERRSYEHLARLERDIVAQEIGVKSF